MILDDLPLAAHAGLDSTLDDLFRAATARHPEAVALIDPPDRGRSTDGESRRLTYAQADRVIAAIAARLRQTGLQPDAVVGLQMANTVDGVLAFLGVLRADLIAMPLPLLWRRADAINAIRRAGASALVVSGRIGATDHFDLAINAAAEAFTVRQVYGFGARPPDGAISLDDVYEAAEAGATTPPKTAPSSRGGGAHLAALTWDMTASGPVPVPRSHAQLIAGGLAVLLESGIPQDGLILSTFAPGTFGGIAMTLVPWLVVGGTLALHHPFAGETFAEQIQAEPYGTVILPGPLVSPLLTAGVLAAPNAPQNIVAAWRAPEQLRRATDWHDQSALTDVQLFGEIGLIAARRPPSGRPVPIPLGEVFAPRAARNGLLVAEVEASPKGTLALRGAMVPTASYPAGAERTALPCHRPTPGGFVDTGYVADIRPRASAALAGGPPAGLVSFGGYRFAVGELKRLVNSLDPSGTLAVRPDTLVGHRLTGTAANPEAIRTALCRIGVNPLLVDAFGGRSRAEPKQVAEYLAHVDPALMARP